MEYYRLLLFIFFGILPSLIWLSYYLAKDLHPEPKRMIIKVFLYGAAVTIPVYFLQVGLIGLLDQLQDMNIISYSVIVFDVLKWFFIIAFTEEVSRYWVVKYAALNNSELDEPLDIMLYMVVAALGFAALENILYLFSPIYNQSFEQVLSQTVTISFIRFIGATFLHTLCSALIGYFWVKSLFDHKRKFFIIIGVLLASLLHGLYDLSIIALRGPFTLLVPGFIIVGLALFMIYDFDEVKKFKGICKL